nr:zinc finger, CCHC-type [Tanacetum cinerariifolium]
MDFIECLPIFNGKSIILVVVDRLSKYNHFIALSHPFTTIQVVNAFMDPVYKLHGLPQVIVSDRDKVFLSLFWKELFKVLDVSLHYSTAYHPQSNGQTEMVNRCLKTYLRCVTGEKPTSVYEQPPPSTIAYVQGQSVMDQVDRSLSDKEAMFQFLKLHLHRAQQKMKILAKVGQVAYKLLSATSQIRLVFHISQLNLYKVPLPNATAILPVCDPQGEMTKQPMKVLDRRLGKNSLLVVSSSGPTVTSNWAVCCTLNPPILFPIPPEGVKVPGRGPSGTMMTMSVEAKYMAEDASSKKFLVSNFTNYKMTDSRPVLEQYNELLGILGRFTQHKMNMDEAVQVSCIIDILSSSWKDFKHTLKHKKEELTLVELGSHLCIKESLRMQDSDKSKGNNVVGSSVVNMVEHNNSSRYNDNKGKRKHQDNIKTDPNKKSKVTCWKCGKPGHLKKDCKGGKVGNKTNGSGTNGSVDVLWNARLGHVHFKRMQDMSKDELILAFDMDTEKCKTCMLNKITKKPFQNVKRKTKVLELIHSDLCDLHATPSPGNKKILCDIYDDASRDAIFDDNRFSSLPRPSLKISNRTKEISVSVVPKEVVQQPEPELRKSKRNRNPKNFRLEFQLYLIEGTRDEVDLTKEFLSSRFSMKDMGEADVIIGIRIKHEIRTPMNTNEKLMPNNGHAVSQLEYSRVIGCLMYAMTCTRPDIAFAVGKISRTPNFLLRKLGSRVQCEKLNVQRTKAHVFTYHPKDVLERAKKEDEVFTS